MTMGEDKWLRTKWNYELGPTRGKLRDTEVRL
jgi:hypothetical protein